MVVNKWRSASDFEQTQNFFYLLKSLSRISLKKRTWQLYCIYYQKGAVLMFIRDSSPHSFYFRLRHSDLATIPHRAVHKRNNSSTCRI